MSFVAGGELSGGIKYAVGKMSGRRNVLYEKYPVGEMSDALYKCLYRSLSSVATVVLFLSLH